MKNDRPASSAPKTNDPHSSAPDSVPAIPSGYQINSVGLLTLEGEEPRPALVLDKSLVGVQFLEWNATPEGGYSTVDASWNHIRFRQGLNPAMGRCALLEMCVERFRDSGSYFYEQNMNDTVQGDAAHRLVTAYHCMLTPEELAADLCQHAFFRWIPAASDSVARDRVRRCCMVQGKGSSAKTRRMVKWVMKQRDLSEERNRRALFEIWTANERALLKETGKIMSAIVNYLDGDEILDLILTRDALCGHSLDVLLDKITKDIDKEKGFQARNAWKEALVNSLRKSPTLKTRDAWLRLSSLENLARLWGCAPKDFLDRYIFRTC